MAAAPAKQQPAAPTRPSKAAPVKKSAEAKSIVKSPVTPEERLSMIAIAAYFRAEQRGFIGGYEMDDWISGEAEIDARLSR